MPNLDNQRTLLIPIFGHKNAAHPRSIFPITNRSVNPRLCFIIFHQIVRRVLTTTWFFVQRKFLYFFRRTSNRSIVYFQENFTHFSSHKFRTTKIHCFQHNERSIIINRDYFSSQIFRCVRSRTKNPSPLETTNACSRVEGKVIARRFSFSSIHAFNLLVVVDGIRMTRVTQGIILSIYSRQCTNQRATYGVEHAR